MKLVLQLAVNGLFTGFAVLPMAMGFALIHGTQRFIHFAHASTAQLAVYLCYLATLVGVPATLGWPLFAQLAVTTAGVGVFGLVMQCAVYEPFRRVNGTAEGMMIVSFGIFTVGEAVFALAFGRDGLPVRESALRTFDVGGIAIPALTLATVALAGCACLLAWVLLYRTRAGLMLRAVATNPDLAETIGLRQRRLRILSMVVGSALVGPTGVAIAYQQGAAPGMGEPLLLLAAVAAIVGGLGSVLGAAVAAAMIGVVQNLALLRLDPRWQTALAFAVLFAFLVCRPRGLFGERQREVQV